MRADVYNNPLLGAAKIWVSCPRRQHSGCSGTLLLGRRCLSRSVPRCATDCFAAQHQFHTAVLLAAFGGLVRGDGLGLAIPVGLDRSGVDPLLDEIVANRLGAVLRKLLIVLITADAIGVSFDLEVQAGIRQYDAGDFRQTLAGGRKKLIAAAAEQYVRHICDEATGGVARGKNRIELLQKPRSEFLLFFFRLLAEVFRLCGSLTGFVGLGGQGLLLGDRIRFGFLRVRFFARCFGGGGLSLLLHAFRVGFRLLGGGASSFGIRAGPFGFGAAFRFCIRVSASFSFAGSRGGLRFLFSFLLNRHHAGFFRGLRSFLCGDFHRNFVLLLAVHFFRVPQLSVRLAQNRDRVLVSGGYVCNTQCVARLEKFQWSLAVDAEDGVLNMGVGGGIRSPRDQFVLGIDVCPGSRHRRAFHDDHVAGLRDREIRFGGDDHAKSLQVG